MHLAAVAAATKQFALVSGVLAAVRVYVVLGIVASCLPSLSFDANLSWSPSQPLELLALRLSVGPSGVALDKHASWFLAAVRYSSSSNNNDDDDDLPVNSTLPT